MTATYTWDVFSTVDGYGSFGPDADWGGYWGKHGPELLEHRARVLDREQRMVYGATTFREVAEIRAAADDPFEEHEWVVRTQQLPATVFSSSLTDTLGWPDASIVGGDAAERVARMKTESDVPIRSQASLSLNWSLLDAGLVDRIQITLFPVITGHTGTSPVLRGVGDLDLELLESRVLDGRTHELVYRPTPHGSV